MLISSHRQTNDSLPEFQVKFWVLDCLGLTSADLALPATCSQNYPRKCGYQGSNPNCFLKELEFNHCATRTSVKKQKRGEEVE